ncbi:3-isopropylmalate dehydratase small subunit [Ascidiimonas sp. W6]|uniref:3-isopropylmalate dehydratase small subunit n=1 Tax=Ascidiimonas meishanensis TaxID=3128903 RepID=UPI0030EBC563
MEKFTKLISTAVPISIENIDTDQIIPARFLKATDKLGFGDNLFRDWRFHKDGSQVSDFPLNNSAYSGSILIAGDNFGCGSSREHAAWALAGYGFKVVISSYFADIFKGNALNNGILPIQVSPEFLKTSLITVTKSPSTELVIDLENQTISIHNSTSTESFDIDPFKKICLINGYDDIDYLVNSKDKIQAYEAQNRD